MSLSSGEIFPSTSRGADVISFSAYAEHRRVEHQEAARRELLQEIILNKLPELSNDTLEKMFGLVVEERLDG